MTMNSSASRILTGILGLALLGVAACSADATSGGEDTGMTLADARATCPGTGNACTTSKRSHGSCVVQNVSDGTACSGGACWSGQCVQAPPPADAGGGTVDAGSAATDSGSGSVDAGSGTTLVGQLPPGAPIDVRMITQVHLDTAAQVTVAFTGTTTRSDAWTAQTMWIAQSMSAGGVGCGSWKTVTSEVLTGFTPGGSYSLYIQYANGVTSPAIAFTMPALGADTQPPVAALPLTLNASANTLTTSATDNTGVKRIDFYANGALIGSTDLSYPWEMWNSYSVAIPAGVSQSATFTAVASDWSGNQTTIAMAPPAGGGTFDSFQQRNLASINAYRATLGVAPLTLDVQLDTFAQAGAVELSQDHLAHQHFITASSNGTLWTSGFSGGAGENQGDPNGWYVMSSDAAQNELSQIDSIMSAMWAEGPSGGHYQNMANANFHRLGVGLLEVSGRLYLTNDFSQ